MDGRVLKDILSKHLAWLRGESEGKRANLRSADLSGADLSGADLRSANLSGADLRSANLSGANLRSADLRSADLYGANLRSADLSGANLRSANLRSADLRSADLYGADLSGAKNLDQSYWNIATAFYALQCPESGAYTAYKKASGRIVELLIPADAKRSSATSRKCRASKAVVVSITDINGNPCENQVRSDHDSSFIYTVGETVEVADFDEDRWNECSTGIHHYITRMEAVKH